MISCHFFFRKGQKQQREDMTKDEEVDKAENHTSDKTISYPKSRKMVMEFAHERHVHYGTHHNICYL